MKILILSNEFPPLGGGTANELFFTLQKFEEFQNLQIDVVTASCDKFQIKDFTNNSTIHFLDFGKKNKNLHFQTTLNLIIYSWKAFFYSFKLLSSKEYNLVFCYSGVPAGFIGLLLKISRKIPYAVRLQGSDVPFY